MPVATTRCFIGRRARHASPLHLQPTHPLTLAGEACLVSRGQACLTRVATACRTESMTQDKDSGNVIGIGVRLNLEETIMRQEPYRRHWLRGLRRWLFAGALVGMAQCAFADSEYAAAWGPSVGSMAPLLAASDQEGKQQTLDTMKGTKGLLFVFNRSVDW